MSFRKIQPVGGDGSLPTVNPTQPIPDSADSRSTDAEPSSRSRSDRDSTTFESTSSSTKRRRVPDTVTRNACVNCKKARAKCDGKTPCQRCAGRDPTDCIYEVHMKHAKEELVKTIKDLRAKEHLSEQILQALSTDEKVPDILARLKKEETYEEIVEWLGRSPLDAFSPTESRSLVDDEMSGITPTDAHRWTSVTSDEAVLHHLLQLYFAWIHPTHNLFNEGHFVDSYKRRLTDYCSSVLVNAVCAMACHLADDSEIAHLGGRFRDNVRSSINPNDKSVTTIQAFAVMFLVDCADANGLRGSVYLQLATGGIASIRTLEAQGFQDVLNSTSRGIRNLNIEWAQMTFSTPTILMTPPFESFGTYMEPGSDEARWYFYRTRHDDQCWPGEMGTACQEKTKLLNIISEAVVMMYGPSASLISASHVLRLYGRLRAWREQLPGTLVDMVNNQAQALPHVLSLFILYSTAVVQLLRPLLDLEGFSSPSMEEVVWKQAQLGLSLLEEQYRAQYSYRYQPVLQMFAMLQLCDAIARFFPEAGGETGRDGTAVVQLGMDALSQAQAGFPVAGPLQELLRRAALEYSVAPPRNFPDLLTGTKSLAYSMDDMIYACTQPSYCQPVAQVHARYVPSFPADWVAESAAFGFGATAQGGRRLRGPSAEERGAQHLMQISNLLNDG